MSKGKINNYINGMRINRSLDSDKSIEEFAADVCIDTDYANITVLDANRKNRDDYDYGMGIDY